MRWLSVSEPHDLAVEETSDLVGRDEEVVRGSTDVHCVLGRESANLVVSETQREWNSHVPAAAAAYRGSEHVVTGFTPRVLITRLLFTPSLLPMHSKDTGRYTLLLGGVSGCMRVGGRMSSREAKVSRRSMGMVFLSKEV